MEKKYKLTDETIKFNGITLYRIEALKDFSDVKKGDKGGFVQSEDNLSHYGDCWVDGDAKVYGNAQVSDDAIVSDNAEVYENAIIYDDAIIYDYAKVYGNAEIYDYAKVYGKAQVYGYAKIFDNVFIFDNAKVYGNAKVYDNARISRVAQVCGNAIIKGDAKVENDWDYITFKNWWSSGRSFVWTRSNNMWSVGCFYGNGKELIEKAYKDSELSGREYERVVNYAESILKDYKRLNKQNLNKTMTKKEAIEYLNESKIYVNGKSEEIQKKLFSLGYKWDTYGEEVTCTDKPFLFIDNDIITYTNNMNFFKSHEYKEITSEELLSIQITYRPFKSQKECWDEMLKHQPFGYIRNKLTYSHH